MPHALWRASQMAAPRAAVTASGFAPLDRELPGRGWPASVLIDLLLPQPGIGEMQLLRPALQLLARRRVALLQPPHAPHAAAWSAWGLPCERLLWVRAAHGADALWSAEQILRNGSCGALLFWQTQIRAEALRRLHLAAQGSDTTLWLLRPLAQAADPSPAALRLALRPAPGGVRVEFVKRRGPPAAAPLLVPLPGFISRNPDAAPVDGGAPAVAAAGSLAPALV